MEKPYSGRAKIQESMRGLVIEIPAKRKVWLLLFQPIWLGGWLLGVLAVSGILLGTIGEFNFNDAEKGWSLFIYFFLFSWLILWVIGGLSVIRSLLWMIGGKEVVTIERGVLKIEKKGICWTTSKIFDPKEVKNLQVSPVSSGLNVLNMEEIYASLVSKRKEKGRTGTLRFDYGLKTIQFAPEIDEAEARYLLEKIESRLQA